jgi:hypothetical protein
LATTRVYILAKEIGVKSSAVVKKCQDEGLDIKNHMSVISAGLAATIHEWFSEGENVTTVETTQKVDLAKVRVKRKKKKAKAEAAESVEVAAVATAEVEIEKGKLETAAEEVEVPSGTAVIAAEEPPPAEEKIAETPEEPQVEPEPEPEPEPIVPAGPMLEKPEPAKLSGPQVVRVEAPEPVRRSRPRARPRPRYDQPVTEPLMYSQTEGAGSGAATTKDKKASPKRSKERTHGRRRDERDTDTTKKGKGISRRGGRGSTLPAAKACASGRCGRSPARRSRELPQPGLRKLSSTNLSLSRICRPPWQSSPRKSS